MKRNKIFQKIYSQLSKKGVSKKEQKKAESDIIDYIKNLQKSVSFDTKLTLKNFIRARR